MLRFLWTSKENEEIYYCKGGNDFLTEIFPKTVVLKTTKGNTTHRFKKEASFILKLACISTFLWFIRTSGGNRMLTLAVSIQTFVKRIVWAHTPLRMKKPIRKRMGFCTKGGTRTHTPLQALDFESNVSTNSTTLA